MSGPSCERAVGGVADLDALGPLDEGIDDLVRPVALDEQARPARADLAGVVERREQRAGDRLVEVRVAEHDVRRLAAELEMDALDVVRRRAEDRLAGDGRAGERELGHVRVGDQRGARRRPVAVDDVEDAGRHPGLERQAAQLGGGERRLLGHLEDDRVADREGRRGLPAGEQERVVPRADRADDAVRLADRVHEVAGVGGVGRAVGQLGVAGEVGQEVGAQVDLADRLAERLARVARLDRADPVGVLVDQVGQARA